MPAFVKRIADIRKGELKPVLCAFLWFFTLMCGYYILRPIRESFGSALGSDRIATLFLVTFVVMLIAVPVYGRIVNLVSRRTLVRIVFHFFGSNILLFAIVIWFGWSSPLIIGRIFFVWASFFSLFAVSVVWSLLADLFTTDQGKRLFGVIASGATVGGICGSLVAHLLVQSIGTAGILLISFACVECGLIFAMLLQKNVAGNFKAEKSQPIDETKIADRSSNVLNGMLAVLKSPFLMLICLYLMMISFCGTSVYLQVADATHDAFPDRDLRTQFFAKMNFLVQIGALVMQTLVVGRVMRGLGLAVALLVTPIVYLTGFVAMGMGGLLETLVLVEVIRRISVYGMTVPAREVLFTAVSREEKYKAKSFIDTCVFRGSDAVSSSAFSRMAAAGVSLSAINWLMVPVAVLWAVLAVVLGISHRLRVREETGTESADRN